MNARYVCSRVEVCVVMNIVSLITRSEVRTKSKTIQNIYRYTIF